MAEEPRTILPGAVRQNGYVVRDVDAAMVSWLAIGVGPWFTMREFPQQNGAYRGELCEPVLSIAFANSGPLQLELIQQHDDGPSIYREFLDAGREGFHHLAWWTDDFPATMAKVEAAGWPVVQSGDGNGVAHFAYFELDGATSTVIEMMELNDATDLLASTVATGADEWDGTTDPVRPLF
jgi:catechol 2,3-dioxygenase-like lactoylglutathione lyase family enzyme